MGRDLSFAFENPAITRVEVLGAQNNPGGDPAALVAPFEGRGPCLVYSREEQLPLNQDVSLALFDASGSLIDQQVVTVTDNFYSGVDASCNSAPTPEPNPNEAPIAVDDDLGENYQGVNLLANDIDPDGDALTARLVAGAQNGSVTINRDGSFSYVPDTGFFGEDSFRYRANDGLLDSTSDGIVTLTVPEPEPPPNRAPEAVDDDFGEGYAGANVLANDSDPDGDPLSASLQSGTSNGTLTLNSDGSFDYTPDIGYSGPESFTYRASDGTLQSNVATVAFTVTLPDENLPPVAMGDDFEADYRDGNVLANDQDPNRDQLYAVLVGEPENGELELNADGSFTYRPYAGYAGPDAFSYKVRDRPPGDPDGLESAPVQVRLQVDGSAAAEGGLTNKQDADGVSVLAGASANELRTSREIDRICPQLVPETDEQRDLQTLCDNLRRQGTTARQALDALKAITPEELTAISKAFRVLSFSRFRNIGARISRVRDGRSRGVSIAGLNLNMGDTRVAGSDLEKMLAETLDAMGLGASADQEEDLLREYSRLGLFVRGDLNFGDQDETELESGFDFDAQTLTVGADYRITDNLFAGASASFGQTEVEFADDGGETRSDNYSVAAYGSVYSGNGYLDGIVSFGWAEVETERNIRYEAAGGAVDRVAEGDTDGAEYYVSFNAGYNFNFGAFNVDPLVRFFYLDGEVDPFTETGAGGWNLDIDEQGFESMSLSAGGQLSYAFLSGWGVITPYLRAEYAHEFEDSADGIRYRFANAPIADSDMLIEAGSVDTSYFVYGAGVSAQFIHGISAFVNYQALGAYDNLNGSSVSVGMRWEANF